MPEIGAPSARPAIGAPSTNGTGDPDDNNDVAAHAAAPAPTTTARIATANVRPRHRRC